jgi:hypothetical protein
MSCGIMPWTRSRLYMLQYVRRTESQVCCVADQPGLRQEQLPIPGGEDAALQEGMCERTFADIYFFSLSVIRFIFRNRAILGQRLRR